MEEDDDEDDKEVTTERKLMNIPSTDGGRWNFGETVHTWTC